MASGPIDPAYTKFLQGLKGVVADPVAKANCRWWASDQAWVDFDPRKWKMEYVSPDKTSTKPAIFELGGLGGSEKSRTVMEDGVPVLFEQIRRDYAALHKAHPQSMLVWAPLSGGTWTGAFLFNKTDPPTTLPKEALERIAKVHEFEHAGQITHDQAQKLIADIVAEYV